MSEINCNKLEITSLRQCDSIKNRENIGPCIIEGPARQDSCQSCQPSCSYWIWPVTHTQISPVKITGYIDFLFLFVSACEREDAVLCASISSTSLEKCGRSYVCVYKWVCVVRSCAQTCTCRKDLNQVRTHLGLQILRVRPLDVCVLIGAVGSCREHTDHISISRYGRHPEIISNTHLHSTLLFAAT